MIINLCNNYGNGDNKEYSLYSYEIYGNEYGNGLGNGYGGGRIIGYNNHGNGFGSSYMPQWGGGYKHNKGNGYNSRYGCSFCDPLLQLYVTRREYVMASLKDQLMITRLCNSYGEEYGYGNGNGYGHGWDSGGYRNSDGNGYGHGWDDGCGCGVGERSTDPLLQLYITRREYIMAVLGS